jgi:Aldo/keto reductase family
LGWPADRGNVLKVLRRVVELGVNLIDTADAYGPETSELLIAEALHPYPKDLVIATKGGLTRHGPRQWVPNGRPGIPHLMCGEESKTTPTRANRINCIASIRKCRWKNRSEHSRRCRKLERFGISDYLKFRRQKSIERARSCQL